jgi:carbon storage regulator
MLILSRKQEESIVIQDDIVITILAIEGDKVKIGIKAPREVQIYREELWLAIQEQNQIVASLAQAQATSGFDGLRAYLVEEIGSGEEPLTAIGDAVDVGQHLSNDGV